MIVGPLSRKIRGMWPFFGGCAGSWNRWVEDKLVGKFLGGYDSGEPLSAVAHLPGLRGFRRN